ncbi:MAG: glutamine-hydrolyzing GMP synthase [Planctomycetota bacterium]
MTAASASPSSVAWRSTDQECIAVVDFGAQYTQLIARRVRDLQVYSEIVPWTAAGELAGWKGLKGVILSGGPRSAYEERAPQVADALLDLHLPMLGICYGMQAMALKLGGEVSRGRSGEYGRTEMQLLATGVRSPLFAGVRARSTVWMSHGDQVITLPPGFAVLASSAPCPSAAMADEQRQLYGIQFHPEVLHTEEGRTLLANFVTRICGCEQRWRMTSFLEESTERIRARVGASRVVLALSGGVDSSVVAVLCQRAVQDRVTPILVDNGLLRKGEVDEVVDTFRGHFHMDLRVADSSARFLDVLRGVTDPEEKRRRIGHVFIDVFREEAKLLSDARFLAQGTLYPDVIESVAAHGGPTATIKTHHNVGGLPEQLGFELIEPLRELFKDEVRELGRLLGLPGAILARHPFPGPGLAVRVLGEVTQPDLDLLRAADWIFRQELHSAQLHDQVAQAFAVLLPVKSVGVKGDARSYERVVALRAVTTADFMTADFAPLPHQFLGRVANRIANEVRGVNRVVYDITSKPPGTIEWE